jgi:hypothetical protein
MPTAHSIGRAKVFDLRCFLLLQVFDGAVWPPAQL